MTAFFIPKLELITVMFSVTSRRLQRVQPHPSQWKYLVVDRCRQRDYMPVVRRQLTGDLPLRLCIRLPIQNPTHMTALLRPHVSRFLSLDLHVPTHKDAERFVSSIGKGQPAPLLERLNISVKHGLVHDIASFAALKNSFYPSPRLTHLSIPSVPLPDISAPLLSNVTSLTIDSIQSQWDFDLFYLLDMLESMPQLKKFTFKGFDNFSFRPTSEINHPRVISMPNLTSVDVSAPGCGLDILRAFDAPLLTSVRFDGYRPLGYQEDPSDALTIPISGSLRRVSERSPMVKCLKLRSTVMHVPLEDYCWLLSDESFPQLEVLRLDGADISDKALRRGRAQMRNLKRLELLNCENVSGKAVKKFVHWHWPGGIWEGRGKNFVVFIYACPSITEEDKVELSKIVTVETKQPFRKRRVFTGTKAPREN